MDKLKYSINGVKVTASHMASEIGYNRSAFYKSSKHLFNQEQDGNTFWIMKGRADKAGYELEVMNSESIKQINLFRKSN